VPIIVGAVAVLVLAVAVGVWQFDMRRPSVEPASIEKMAYPLPEKPSVAVLPFVNMSGYPEQEYFSDGITENIIMALSKTPKLFVIARNSTFVYKDKPINIKQAAEELGVRYILKGSVQKTENRVRITAQLIDAALDNRWSKSRQKDIERLFELSEKIFTLDESSAQAHMILARYYFNLGSQESQQIHNMLFSQLAEYYRRAGRFEEAIATGRKILESNPICAYINRRFGGEMF
jgi:TolB-like protein